MNIAKIMKKAIPILNEGLDGIRFHLKPEGEEFWTKNYAIAIGMYYDYPLSDYFNHDQFQRDFEKKAIELFPKCEVIFYWRSQELEVIYD